MDQNQLQQSLVALKQEVTDLKSALLIRQEERSALVVRSEAAFKDFEERLSRIDQLVTASNESVSACQVEVERLRTDVRRAQLAAESSTEALGLLQSRFDMLEARFTRFWDYGPMKFLRKLAKSTLVVERK